MGDRPLVIAHRGASGYLPEHTAEAKALAYGMGADYLEQDVVATRDAKLIVMHDVALDAVTDVASVFPARARSDGRYYAIDFDLAEIQRLRVIERRRALGGFVPARRSFVGSLRTPERKAFAEFHGGFEREVSTTMAFVQMLRTLLKDPEIGPRIVPIVPDEARTFGMESLFRQYGIYASSGQLYTPVDAGTLLFYHESKTGQILEEGITEAGSMCSFTAAGTSYATQGEIVKESQLVSDRSAGRVDDFRSSWRAPASPGTVRLWVTLNDERGGAAWTSFDVIVE